jgi:cobalamin synthase
MQEQQTVEVALTVAAVFGAVIAVLDALVRRLPPPDEARLLEHRIAARKGVMGVVVSGALLLAALRSHSPMLGVVALAGLLTATLVTLVRDRLSHKQRVSRHEEIAPVHERLHPWLPRQRDGHEENYGRRATDHRLSR